MGKLVLTRMPRQSIRLIHADGTETVIEHRGRERTSLAIDAPPTVRVLRGELELRPDEGKRPSAT